jgi:dUTP pyrophosphatase
MKLKIKRFDNTLPLPEYKTKGAVALDLCSRETMIVPAKGISYIPLNVAIEIPLGSWVMLAPRSSTHKLGIIQANGVGIFDQDFCGDGDEYKFIAFNFTDNDVTVERGTRIAQIIPLNFNKILEIEEVEKMENKTRGGIGSTGTI